MEVVELGRDPYTPIKFDSLTGMKETDIFHFFTSIFIVVSNVTELYIKMGEITRDY